MTMRLGMATVMAAALVAGMAQAQAPAQKPQPPMSTAPGAGAGPGPGVGAGGCPGWGYGPWGGHGMGPGMGYGMGPGMMGGGPGYGQGPGYGMGYGYGMLAGLNLNENQRKAINKILDDQQKAQYETMGKIVEQNSRLRDLYSREKWDSNAIAGVYDQINKQRALMIRSRIDARNKIYDVLTPEQRQQFRQWGPMPSD